MQRWAVPTMASALFQPRPVPESVQGGSRVVGSFLLAGGLRAAGFPRRPVRVPGQEPLVSGVRRDHQRDRRPRRAARPALKRDGSDDDAWAGTAGLDLRRLRAAVAVRDPTTRADGRVRRSPGRPGPLPGILPGCGQSGHDLGTSRHAARTLPGLVAVSSLGPGDEKFHYHDGSHRWFPPDPETPQKVWEEMVRQHKEKHLRPRPVDRRDRP